MAPRGPSLPLGERLAQVMEELRALRSEVSRLSELADDAVIDATAAYTMAQAAADSSDVEKLRHELRTELSHFAVRLEEFEYYAREVEGWDW